MSEKSIMNMTINELLEYINLLVNENLKLKHKKERAIFKIDILCIQNKGKERELLKEIRNILGSESNEL